MKRLAIPVVTLLSLTACRDDQLDPLGPDPDILANQISPTNAATGVLLGTTNNGELVEIDFDAGTAELLGDAGTFDGKELGWTGLSFDPASGDLFATSRFRSEQTSDGCEGFFPGGRQEGCSHLYRLNPRSGAVRDELGDLGVQFVSDIDFAASGVLYGSMFFNTAPSGEGGLITVDTDAATITRIGQFGPNPSGRELENGGLAVDPATGNIWGIESGFVKRGGGIPHVFRVDPVTGGAMDAQPLTLDGQPVTSFGVDALEIMRDGQFVVAEAGGGNRLHLVDPATGALTPLSITVSPDIAGGINGLETPPPVFPFASFDLQRAEVEFDPQGRLNRDAFLVEGAFALAPESDGIDLTRDDVTVVLGGFAPIIAAGAFARTAADDGFEFLGEPPGITRAVIGDDGTFLVTGDDLDLTGIDLIPTPFVLQIKNDIGEAEVVFERVGGGAPPAPTELLGTTNRGELVRIDLRARTATLIGAAGTFEGRKLGWTGITFDAQGRLLVSSRIRSELPGQGCVGFFETNGGACAHLYEIDPATGLVLAEVGNTERAFLSDIDLGTGGTLFGSIYINERQSLDGGLVTLDPGTGTATFVNRYGSGGGDRDLDNGGLALHPATGDLWGVETALFRVDPNTGLAIGPVVPLMSGGGPLAFAFDALEILPDGRFLATRGAGSSQLYLLDPATGNTRLIPLVMDEAIQGGLNGLESAETVLPFDDFAIKFALLRQRRHGAPNRDMLFMLGTFVSSNGVDPLSEVVVVSFGGGAGFEFRIPEGSFVRQRFHRKHFRGSHRGRERFVFRGHGREGGIKRMEIRDDGSFMLWVRGVDLSEVVPTDPVDFQLRIGDEAGAFAIPFNRFGFYIAHRHSR